MNSSTTTVSSPSQLPSEYDLTDSPSATPSCSPPPSGHPLHAALLTKKKILGKLADRINIISNLLKQNVERFLLENLTGEDHKEIKEKTTKWFNKYRTVNTNKRLWRVHTVATTLCKFDKIYTYFLAKCAVVEAVIPTAIKEFKSFMTEKVSQANTVLEIENGTILTKKKIWRPKSR